MSKLAGVSGKAAIKAFERIGYTVARTKGSHATLNKPNSPTLVIPLHKEVSVFLLKAQIQRAGLDEDRFLELLRGK